jgi:hypothetical protein
VPSPQPHVPVLSISPRCPLHELPALRRVLNTTMLPHIARAGYAMLLVLLLGALRTVATNCYYPDGSLSVAGDGPCSKEGGACCPLHWQCMSNGLCFLENEVRIKRYKGPTLTETFANPSTVRFDRAITDDIPAPIRAGSHRIALRYAPKTTLPRKCPLFSTFFQDIDQA